MLCILLEGNNDYLIIAFMFHNYLISL